MANGTQQTIFNPNAPFQAVKRAKPPKFDPSAPFQVISKTTEQEQPSLPKITNSVLRSEMEPSPASSTGIPSEVDVTGPPKPLLPWEQKISDFVTKPLISKGAWMIEHPEFSLFPALISKTMRKGGLKWEADLYDDVTNVVSEQVRGMTSPLNIALLFSGGLLEKVPMLAKATAGVFSVTQAKDAVNQVKQAIQLYKDGNPREGRKLLMGGAVSTVFSILSAAGMTAKTTPEGKTVGPEKPIPFDPIDEVGKSGPEGEKAAADLRAWRLRSKIIAEQKRTAVEHEPIRQQRIQELEKIPAPEKRSFEEEPVVVRGRQPMTREERDQQWLDERKAQIQKEIEEGKKLRADVFARSFDEAREARERALREGKGVRVIERRGATAEEPPTTIRALEPPPVAPEAPGREIQPSTERLKDIETSARLQNMELEKQKATATPEKYEEILKNQEDNRDLIEKTIQERQAAEAAMQGRKKAGSLSYDFSEDPKAIVGKEFTLKTVSNNLRSRYIVTEAKDAALPSHDPQTFEPTKKYPKGLQQRQYDKDKSAQLSVINKGENHNPSLTLSDTPTPTDGPPIVTRREKETGERIAVGGNDRLMGILRMYAEGKGEEYKNQLIERTSQLGLDSERTRSMKEPVLQREILNAPTDLNDLHALGWDLNRPLTKQLSEYERAVSAGKRLTPETLDFVGQELTALGEDSSLRDLLRERPRQLLERFEADGIIAPTERRAFMDEKTGTLNDAGKDFIENSLLGAVIDDPNVLANAPKGILHKLERSLAPLARIRARDGAWDITDYLTEALREHVAAQTKGVSLDEYWNPPTAEMFPRPPVHPIVRGLAAELDKPSNEIKKDFEGYARDAEGDVKDQATMAFYVPPKPWESFKDNFGADVNPADWGTTRPQKAEIPELPKALPSPEVKPTDFRAQLKDAFPKLPDEQIDSTLVLIDARARSAGMTRDAWLESRIAGVERGGTGKKGAVQFLDDNRAVIQAFESADISTALHELAHIFRRDLSGKDRAIAEKWVGVKDGDWKKSHEEKFARGFERYLYEGKAPTKEMVGVFDRFKDWLKNVYQAVKDSQISVKLTPEIRGVFDRLLVRPGEMGPPPEAGISPEAIEKMAAPVSDLARVEGLKAETTALKDRLASGRGSAEDRRKAERRIAENKEMIKEFGERRKGARREAPTAPHPAELGITPEEKTRKEEKAEVANKKYIDRAIGPQKVGGIYHNGYWDKNYEVLKIDRNDKTGNWSITARDLAGDVRERTHSTPWDYKRDKIVKEPLTLSLEETPSRLSMAESIKSMSDSDLRTARDSIQSQLRRRGLSATAHSNLEAQIRPFEDEIKRRGLSPKTGTAYGSKNIIFTKERHDAALQRIREKMGRLHAGIDPAILRDVAEVMAYHFEAGIHSFVDIAHATMDEMGKHFGPYMKPAYDMMIRNGKDEVQRKLFTTLPEDQRRQLSNQLNLFERKLPEVMGLEKPPAEMEVEREKPKAVVQREPAHERLRPEERPRVGEASPEAPERRVVSTKPTAGRGVRSPGEIRKPGGIVEAPAPTIRVVKPPVIEAEPLEIVGSSVDPEEWKRELRAAKLPENLPPPTEELSPEVDSKLIFRGQPEIVRTALTSLRRYGAAVISTGTGSGKTYSGSAILAELKPNWGVIITPSQPVLRKWMDVAAGFGVDVKPMPKNEPPTEPGVYIETYRGAQGRGWLKNFKWDVLLADESHYARRWYDSSRGQMLLDLSKNSNKTAFISATPFHNALELGYLDKLGLWKKSGRDVWLNREFGVRFDPDTGKPIVPHNPRKLAALRDELINRGMMVSLDRDMRNYCYSIDTEILTQRGWIDIGSVLLSDKVATRSIEHKFEWQNPTEVQQFHYSGVMIHFKAKSLDAIVTPNHRMVVAIRGSNNYGRYQDDIGPEKIKIASEIAEVSTNYVIPMTSFWIGKLSVPPEISKLSCDLHDLVAFLGIYLAEGSCAGSSGGKSYSHRTRVIVHQYRSSDNYKEIAELVDRLPWRFNHEAKGFVCGNRKELHSIVNPLGNKYHKFVPQWVKELPIEYLKVLWKWYVKGDGCIDKANRNAVSASTTSKKLADDFQEILQKIGKHASVRTHRPKHQKILNQPLGRRPATAYKISELKTNYRKATCKQITYDGKVACVSVPNGIVYVRRNGHALWSGNSVNFSVVPLSGENQQEVRNIVQGFKLAEDYFKRKRSPKLMAARGNAATFMKSYLERTRLNEAIDMGKRLENEGWKVIYFTENKSEVNEIYDFLKEPDAYFGGEISRLIPKLPGVVETLKGAFGEDLANFTGADSPSRAAELEAFMNGDKKHMIATYGAGGVGVDMHDMAGDAPRAAIYLGPPWSGVMFDQAVGRPWRFGTKSNVSAYVLTSNAGPEMKLVFQKVLPRFESLKAAISGIKKTDPIVKAMRDLDSFLDYESGNDTAANISDFLQTVQTNAVTSYKEAPITSAEDAKGKGMKVERRFLLDKPPGELSTLYQEEIPEPPEDLPEDTDEVARNAASSAAATRRMFVPEKASKDISDPRLLDQLDDENRRAVGLPPEENKPPAPPGEIIGNRQVPRPGEADVRTLDLGAPKIMARIREFQINHFKGFGLPDAVIKPLAEIETAARLGLAKWHTAPYILSQFKETSGIARAMTDAEMKERRQVADMRYTYQHDIMGKFYGNDIAERKIDEALRRTDQTGNTMELLGENSKWVDGSPFTKEELTAAQRIRNEIYEPIIQMVRQVRPDVGYRRKYSTVLRTVEDLTSTLYPELHGKVPADLFAQFSLEVKQAMTKDPFSPYTLERKGTPPKAFNISDIMDAYIPSMLRVAHYTPMARRLGILINRLPESRLKDYTKRYARIFFGVPDEYQHLQNAIYRGSRHIINTTYAAALELNPYWFVMHLSKTAVNTFPELGKDSFKYLMAGANASTTEAGREILGRSGILLDTLWSHPDAMLGPAKELKRHPSNWMRLTTSLSDAIDRGIAYLGALEKAKDLGMLGDKEKVGDITWDRLNELAANGVDVEKALDFAYSSAARSQFMYTPAHLEIISREHPFLFQFKHYFVRESEFIANMRKLAKEAKAQNVDGYTFAMQKAAEGKYEYIDAVAKYHRLLMALVGAAATAFGIGGQLFGRLWPIHMAAFLSPGVAWSDQTFELMHLTMQGRATKKQWAKWFYRTLGLFIPGAGFAIRTATATPPKKKKSGMAFTPPPGEKFQLQPTPQ